MGSSEADTKGVLDTFPSDATEIDKRSLLNEQPQHSVTIPRAFGMGSIL
jgi:hypothetical protein